MSFFNGSLKGKVTQVARNIVQDSDGLVEIIVDDGERKQAFYFTADVEADAELTPYFLALKNQEVSAFQDTSVGDLSISRRSRIELLTGPCQGMVYNSNW